MPYKPIPKRIKNQVQPKKSWSGTDFKYNSVEWIKLRNLVRNEEPLCRTCKAKGIIRPTEIIDHIKPILDGGEALDRDNLQGLCTTCHNAKSAKERNKRQ